MHAASKSAPRRQPRVPDCQVTKNVACYVLRGDTQHATRNTHHLTMTNFNPNTWWTQIDPPATGALAQIWTPIGLPGYAGLRKHRQRSLLDGRFGADGWRIGHYVRGRIVSKAAALVEYEQSYRVHLRSHPEQVEFLVACCGNVYDDNPSNVYDHDYEQPHTRQNHYQDISVRRVIAELVDDPGWPHVTATVAEEVELLDLTDGVMRTAPRSPGMRGAHLLQIRGLESPAFFLNPAVVPVHDPSLITAHPQMDDWYLHEGCQHLSVEAFWQMSKVIEVRYDRFLALGAQRLDPLAGLE